MEHDLARTEQEWRERLTAEQYAVLRQAGTEPAFSGDYVDTEEPGVYRCAACRAVLFDADDKFHSGSGWPSFTRPVADNRVQLRADTSHGMRRTEVVCGQCGSHLGHVFDDGPRPTRQRYCINSVALELDPGREGR